MHKTKRIVILGGKGIGMIAAYVASQLEEFEVLGLLNDSIPVGEMQGKFMKFPVIGKSQQVHEFISQENTYAIVAYKTMKKERMQWWKLVELSIPREKLVNLIHPSTNIPYGFCHLGNGLLIAPGTQVSPDAVISDNCILLGNSFIGHDSFLDNYVSIANNASVGARVRIRTAVHVGSNATIKQGVVIGDFSLIGMGSVVLHDVPARAIMAGVPAKQIGETD